MARQGNAVFKLSILADTSDAKRKLTLFGRDLTGLQSALSKMAVPAGVAIGALGALGKSCAEAASQLEQTTGSVDAVFKNYANQIHAYARNSAQQFGISTSDFNKYAAVLGAMLKNTGMSYDHATEKTIGLMKVSRDLAATYGTDVATAVESISALMRGETDPIEKYGIAIKQSDVNARMAAEGLDKLTGEDLKQAEMNTRLKLLYEQSADALGGFAREADTMAQAQERANAEWENAKAKLGQALTPIMTKFANALAKVAQFAADHPRLMTGIAIAAGTLAGVILTLNGFMWALNIAQTAVAIGWAAALWPAAIVLGIGVVIAGIGYLIYKVYALRDALLDATGFDMFKYWWNATIGYVVNKIIWLQNKINELKMSWQIFWDGITSDSFSWSRMIGGWIFGSGEIDLTAINGTALTSRAGIPAPVAYRNPAAQPGRPINVTINGPIDATETARELRRILGNYQANYLGGRAYV